MEKETERKKNHPDEQLPAWVCRSL